MGSGGGYLEEGFLEDLLLRGSVTVRFIAVLGVDALPHLVGSFSRCRRMMKLPRPIIE